MLPWSLRIPGLSLAFQIRDQLKDSGVVLEDTPQGPRWKYLGV